MRVAEVPLVGRGPCPRGRSTRSRRTGRGSPRSRGWRRAGTPRWAAGWPAAARAEAGAPPPYAPGRVLVEENHYPRQPKEREISEARRMAEVDPHPVEARRGVGGRRDERRVPGAGERLEPSVAVEVPVDLRAAAHGVRTRLATVEGHGLPCLGRIRACREPGEARLFARAEAAAKRQAAATTISARTMPRKPPTVATLPPRPASPCASVFSNRRRIISMVMAQDPLASFTPQVRDWFLPCLREARPRPRSQAWPAIAARRQRAAVGPDRLRQDAVRVPLGARPPRRQPAPGGREEDPARLRLAAQGARRTTSSATCAPRSRGSAATSTSPSAPATRRSASASRCCASRPTS